VVVGVTDAIAAVDLLKTPRGRETALGHMSDRERNDSGSQSLFATIPCPSPTLFRNVPQSELCIPGLRKKRQNDDFETFPGPSQPAQCANAKPLSRSNVRAVGKHVSSGRSHSNTQTCRRKHDPSRDHRSERKTATHFCLCPLPHQCGASEVRAFCGAFVMPESFEYEVRKRECRILAACSFANVGIKGPAANEWC
jgi:hypothetical protein